MNPITDALCEATAALRAFDAWLELPPCVIDNNTWQTQGLVVDLADLCTGVGGWELDAQFILAFWELSLTYLLEIQTNEGAQYLPRISQLRREDFILVQLDGECIYNTQHFSLKLDFMSLLECSEPVGNMDTDPTTLQNIVRSLDQLLRSLEYPFAATADPPLQQAEQEAYYNRALTNQDVDTQASQIIRSLQIYTRVEQGAHAPTLQELRKLLTDIRTLHSSPSELSYTTYVDNNLIVSQFASLRFERVVAGYVKGSHIICPEKSALVGTEDYYYYLGGIRHTSQPAQRKFNICQEIERHIVEGHTRTICTLLYNREQLTETYYNLWVNLRSVIRNQLIVPVRLVEGDDHAARIEAAIAEAVQQYRLAMHRLRVQPENIASDVTVLLRDGHLIKPGANPFTMESATLRESITIDLTVPKITLAFLGLQSQVPVSFWADILPPPIMLIGQASMKEQRDAEWSNCINGVLYNSRGRIRPAILSDLFRAHPPSRLGARCYFVAATTETVQRQTLTGGCSSANLIMLAQRQGFDNIRHSIRFMPATSALLEKWESSQRQVISLQMKITIFVGQLALLIAARGERIHGLDLRLTRSMPAMLKDLQHWQSLHLLAFLSVGLESRTSRDTSSHAKACAFTIFNRRMRDALIVAGIIAELEAGSWQQGILALCRLPRYVLMSFGEYALQGFQSERERFIKVHQPLLRLLTVRQENNNPPDNSVQLPPDEIRAPSRLIDYITNIRNSQIVQQMHQPERRHADLPNATLPKPSRYRRIVSPNRDYIASSNAMSLLCFSPTFDPSALDLTGVQIPFFDAGWANMLGVVWRSANVTGSYVMQAFTGLDRTHVGLQRSDIEKVSLRPAAAYQNPSLCALSPMANYIATIVAQRLTVYTLRLESSEEILTLSDTNPRHSTATSITFTSANTFMIAQKDGAASFYTIDEASRNVYQRIVLWVKEAAFDNTCPDSNIANVSRIAHLYSTNDTVVTEPETIMADQSNLLDGVGDDILGWVRNRHDDALRYQNDRVIRSGESVRNAIERANYTVAFVATNGECRTPLIGTRGGNVTMWTGAPYQPIGRDGWHYVQGTQLRCGAMGPNEHFADSYQPAFAVVNGPAGTVEILAIGRIQQEGTSLCSLGRIVLDSVTPHTSLLISPDGNWVLAGAERGPSHVIRLRLEPSRAPLSKYGSIHSSSVRCLPRATVAAAVFAPTGKHLFVLHADDKIRVWNIESLEAIRSVEINIYSSGTKAQLVGARGTDWLYTGGRYLTGQSLLNAMPSDLESHVAIEETFSFVKYLPRTRVTICVNSQGPHMHAFFRDVGIRRIVEVNAWVTSLAGSDPSTEESDCLPGRAEIFVVGTSMGLIKLYLVEADEQSIKALQTFDAYRYGQVHLIGLTMSRGHPTVVTVQKGVVGTWSTSRGGLTHILLIAPTIKLTERAIVHLGGGEIVAVFVHEEHLFVRRTTNLTGLRSIMQLALKPETGEVFTFQPNLILIGPSTAEGQFVVAYKRQGVTAHIVLYTITLIQGQWNGLDDQNGNWGAHPTPLTAHEQNETNWCTSSLAIHYARAIAGNSRFYAVLCTDGTVVVGKHCSAAAQLYIPPYPAKRIYHDYRETMECTEEEVLWTTRDGVIRVQDLSVLASDEIHDYASLTDYHGLSIIGARFMSKCPGTLALRAPMDDELGYMTLIQY